MALIILSVVTNKSTVFLTKIGALPDCYLTVTSEICIVHKNIRNLLTEFRGFAMGGKYLPPGVEVQEDVGSDAVPLPEPQRAKFDEQIIGEVNKGLLPHEILLRAARGEKFVIRTSHTEFHEDGPDKGLVRSEKIFDQAYYPTFSEQINCAKAAAPYYTPRLTMPVLKPEDGTSEALTKIFEDLSKALPS